MFIPVAIADDLTLRLPQFFCCNCGSAQEIRPITTMIRYRVLGRPEVTIRPQLPYCRGCTKSSKREPVGLVKKAVVAALFALALALIVSIVPLPHLPRLVSEHIFYVAAAVALAVVFAFYALQKPRDNQTSYHQPLRLKRARQERSGRIVNLTLAFTNEKYAEMFIAANKEVISIGAVAVLSSPRRAP